MLFFPSLVVIVFILLASVKSFLLTNRIKNSPKSHTKEHRRIISLSNEPSPDVSGINGDNTDLDALFDQISGIDPKDVTPEMQQAIQDRIDQNAPAPWKVRLQVMGFTPLTIAGYVVAFILIGLNTVLGTGWAGDLLGFNETPTVVDSYYTVGKMDEIQSANPTIGSSTNRWEEIDAAIKANIDEIRLKTQNSRQQP